MDTFEDDATKSIDTPSSSASDRGFDGGESAYDPSLLDPQEELYSLCERCAGPNDEDGIERVRRWLRDPSREERETPMAFRGNDDKTAIHLVCEKCLPPDVVDDIIAYYPDSPNFRDSHGCLPIHYACASSKNGSRALVFLLCKEFAEGVGKVDRRGRTPLHVFLSKEDSSESGDATADTIRLLSQSGAAEVADNDNGMLPMHYACAYMFGKEKNGRKYLDALFEAFPGSIAAGDKRGRTPLHFACVNCARDGAPEVIDFLLSRGAEYGIINIKDKDGHRPLFKFALRRWERNADASQENVQRSLLVILNALEDLPGKDFALLQSLPAWLQAEVFSSPGSAIQSILNEHISKPFPTMVLFLDFYFLILLIIFFQLASSATIECVFSNKKPPNAFSSYLAMVLFSGFYFLLREVSQVISLKSVNLLKQAWAKDVTNHVDVLSIILTFMWYGLMKESYASGDCEGRDLAGKEWYHAGMALTSGLYWLSFLLLLRATSVDFAVFMGGMFHVLKSLGSFVACLGIILVAFAQMFFIVFKETSFCLCHLNEAHLDEMQSEECEVYLGTSTSFCTFSQSLLQMYFMMLGEIDTDAVTYNTMSTFLVCIYIFAVVMLLANALIAIVTEAYVFVKNTDSAKVFWVQRFNFLAEVKAITVGFQDLCRGKEFSLLDDYEKRKREMWTGLIKVFEEDALHDFADNINLFSRFLFALVWAVSATAFISWVLVGFASAGLLWPPQIREYILQQKPSQQYQKYHDNMMKRGIGPSEGVRTNEEARTTKGFVSEAQYKEALNEVKTETIAAVRSDIAEIKKLILLQGQKSTNDDDSTELLMFKTSTRNTIPM